MLLFRHRKFIGFANFHVEQAYLKSSFYEVWEKAEDFMTASCTRVREDATANPYIFRYWQFAKNKFYPKKRSGLIFSIGERKILDNIKKALTNKAIVSICINDNPACTETEFMYVKNQLQQLFQKKLPLKSSFEI